MSSFGGIARYPLSTRSRSVVSRCVRAPARSSRQLIVEMDQALARLSRYSAAVMLPRVTSTTMFVSTRYAIAPAGSIAWPADAVFVRHAVGDIVAVGPHA